MQKVSAVVATYNSGGTIRKCLESLLLNKVDEIVIVDGGSSDDTLSKVRLFIAAQVIQVTGGIGKAKDEGWRAARHNRILFLDSDAFIPQGTLVRLASHFLNADIAGVSCVVKCANREFLLARLRDFDFAMDYSRIFAYSEVAECVFDPVMCGLFTKESLQRVGGFDREYSYAEDLKLLEQMKTIGRRVLVARDAAVFHYHRANYRDLYVQSYRHGMGRRMFSNEFGSKFYERKDIEGFMAGFARNLALLGMSGLLAYPSYRMLKEVAFLMGYLHGHSSRLAPSRTKV